MIRSEDNRVKLCGGYLPRLNSLFMDFYGNIYSTEKGKRVEIKFRLEIKTCSCLSLLAQPTSAVFVSILQFDISLNSCILSIAPVFYL